jgi:glycerol kinase
VGPVAGYSLGRTPSQGSRSPVPLRGARELAESGDLLFGNIDSYLVWKLTGGTNGGIHVTDVTNASRTQLMDLHSLSWDKKLLQAFEIPEAVLPRIVSSSEV